MNLSDLVGAGNDEINMRPLAHAFVPKGNRLQTVNAVARGFLRSWAGVGDDAAPADTAASGHPLPDGFQREQIAQPGRVQCGRRICRCGDCHRPHPSNPMPWLR